MPGPTQEEIYFVFKSCRVANGEKDTYMESTCSYNTQRTLFVFACKELDAYVVVFKKDSHLADWYSAATTEEEEEEEEGEGEADPQLHSALVRQSQGLDHSFLAYLIEEKQRRVILSGWGEAGALAALVCAEFSNRYSHLQEQVACIAFGALILEGPVGAPRARIASTEDESRSQSNIHVYWLEGDIVPSLLLLASDARTDSTEDIIEEIQDILTEDKGSGSEELESFVADLVDKTKVGAATDSRVPLWHKLDVSILEQELDKSISTTPIKGSWCESALDILSRADKTSIARSLRRHKLSEYNSVIKRMPHDSLPLNHNPPPIIELQITSVRVTPLLRNDGYVAELVIEGRDLPIIKHVSLVPMLIRQKVGRRHRVSDTAICIDWPIDQSSIEDGRYEAIGTLVLHTIVGDHHVEIKPADLMEFSDRTHFVRTSTARPKEVLSSAFIFCSSTVNHIPEDDVVDTYQKGHLYKVGNQLNKILANIPLDSVLENLPFMLGNDEMSSQNAYWKEVADKAISHVKESLQAHFETTKTRFPVTVGTFKFMKSRSPLMDELHALCALDKKRLYMDHEWKLFYGQTNVFMDLFYQVVNELEAREEEPDAVMNNFYRAFDVYKILFYVSYEGSEFLRESSGIMKWLTGSKSINGYPAKVEACADYAGFQQLGNYELEGRVARHFKFTRLAEESMCHKWYVATTRQIRLLHKLRNAVAGITNTVALLPTQSFNHIPINRIYPDAKTSYTMFPQPVSVAPQQRDSLLVLFPVFPGKPKQRHFVDAGLLFLEALALVVDLNHPPTKEVADKIIHLVVEAIKYYRSDVLVLVTSRDDDLEAFEEFSKDLRSQLKQLIPPKYKLEKRLRIELINFESSQPHDVMWGPGQLHRWITNVESQPHHHDSNGDKVSHEREGNEEDANGDVIDRDVTVEHELELSTKPSAAHQESKAPKHVEREHQEKRKNSSGEEDMDHDRKKRKVSFLSNVSYVAPAEDTDYKAEDVSISDIVESTSTLLNDE